MARAESRLTQSGKQRPRRGASVVCVVAAASLSAAVSSAQKNPLLEEYETRKRAEAFDVAGKRVDALREWFHVVKLCRREAHHSCAHAKARVVAIVREENACNALKEARQLLEKGLETALRRVEILCAIRSGRLNRAAKPLRALIVREVDSSDGIWARDSALPLFTKAGGHWPALSAREQLESAAALRRAKRFEEALGQFRAIDNDWRAKGIEAELRRTIPFEIAITEFRAGALDAAEAGFRRLLKEARTLEQADGLRVWLGWTRQKQGKAEDAAKLFEQVYARRPREENSRPHLLRAIDALKRSQETARLARLYERLGVDYPGHRASVELAYRAVRVYADAELYKAARAAAARYIRRFATSRRHADAEWMFAWSTFKLREWKRAIALFNALAARARFGSGAPSEGAAYWAAIALERLGKASASRAKLKRLAAMEPVGFFGHLARSHSLTAAALNAAPIVPVETKTGESAEIDRAFKAFTHAHPLATRPAMRALAFVQKGLLDEADRELFRVQEQIRAAKGGPKVSVVPPPSSSDRRWMRRTARSILFDINSLHRVLGNVNRISQNLRFSYGYRLNGDDARLRAAFPTPFSTVVSRAARAHGVPLDLVYAIMHTESSFTPDAISPANAHGLMQILPSTARRIAKQRAIPYDARDLHDIARNVDFGIWYLRELLLKFHGQTPLAIAAYNGGPHNIAAWLDKRGTLPVDEFLEDIPFRETRFYVRKVIAALGLYRKIYGTRGDVFVSNVLDPRYENNINF